MYSLHPLLLPFFSCILSFFSFYFLFSLFIFPVHRSLILFSPFFLCPSVPNFLVVHSSFFPFLLRIFVVCPSFSFFMSALLFFQFSVIFLFFSFRPSFVFFLLPLFLFLPPLFFISFLWLCFLCGEQCWGLFCQVQIFFFRWAVLGRKPFVIFWEDTFF